MKAVKQSIARGVAAEQAIRAALLANGLTVREFAAKYEVPYSSTTQALRGSARPTDEQVAALVKELGGNADEWRLLLWETGRPDVTPPKPAKAAAG